MSFAFASTDVLRFLFIAIAEKSRGMPRSWRSELGIQRSESEVSLRLSVGSTMPDEESDISKTALNRVANALEHIACSLVAMELSQAAQEGGVCDDSLYAHRRFEHENCIACGNKAQSATESMRKRQTSPFEARAVSFGGRKS